MTTIGLRLVAAVFLVPGITANYDCSCGLNGQAADFADSSAAYPDAGSPTRSTADGGEGTADGGEGTADGGESDGGDGGPSTRYRTEFDAKYHAFKEWVEREENQFVSSDTVLVMHQTFWDLTSMGDRAIPFVMEKIADGDRLMQSAASKIVGINMYIVNEDRCAGPVCTVAEGQQFWLEWWSVHRAETRWYQ